MVTGDNLETAKTISINAGILTPEEAKGEWACVEGKVFREYVGEVVQDKDLKSGLIIERPKEVQKFQ